MKGKHVLITGHTGFKGSWLVAMLHNIGARVSGLSLDPIEGGIFEKAAIHEFLVHDFRRDIRDLDGVKEAFQLASPDVVIHLAAQPLVLTSYDNPEETYSTNVMGTLNVLQALEVTATVKAALVITTDKVYRQSPGQTRAFVESDALGAADPYSTSKAMADLLAQSWMSSHPIFKVAIARAGNVIGGGDVSENRLLPDLLSAFGKGHHAHVRNPESVRPWQHVLDCLAGYLALTEALLTGTAESGAYNFGPAPEHPLRVREVAQIAAEAWGSESSWVAEEQAQPNESQFLILDSKKAKSVLGWEEKLAAKDAIEWTVEWSRRQFDGESARTLIFEQLSSFAWR